MKENQEFNTVDAILSIFMMIILSATLASAFQTIFSDSSIDMAKIQAEKIAIQILSSLRGQNEVAAQSPLGSHRKIASITNEKINPLDVLGPSGEISKDPWGQPYLFRVLNGTQGKKVAIVWSMGPDQRSDTPESMVSKHEKNLNFESLSFGGDDLGVVVFSD